MQDKKFEEILKIVTENEQTHFNVVFDTAVEDDFFTDLFTSNQQKQLVTAFSKNTAIISIKVGFPEAAELPDDAPIFNELSEHSMSAFFPLEILAVHKQLVQLDFSGMPNMTESGIYDLVTELICQKYPLESLSFSGNFLFASDQADNGLHHIAKLLRATDSLKHLDLSHTIYDATCCPVSIGAFLIALAVNATLKSIDLSDNPGLSSHFIATLGAALESNTGIEYVNLSGCNVSKQSATELHRIFESLDHGHPGIKRPLEIDLSNNPEIDLETLALFKKEHDGERVDVRRMEEHNLTAALALLKESFSSSSSSSALSSSSSSASSRASAASSAAEADAESKEASDRPAHFGAGLEASSKKRGPDTDSAALEEAVAYSLDESEDKPTALGTQRQEGGKRARH